MMPQRIAFAHERKVIGTLLLNLLFAMFEHNEAHLKRHFGASLETMTVGIAVLLAQLASRPTSVVRLAQLLGARCRKRAAGARVFWCSDQGGQPLHCQLRSLRYH